MPETFWGPERNKGASEEVRPFVINVPKSVSYEKNFVYSLKQVTRLRDTFNMLCKIYHYIVKHRIVRKRMDVNFVVVINTYCHICDYFLLFYNRYCVIVSTITKNKNVINENLLIKL